MAMFVLMTKMTPEVSSDLQRREAVGKAWKQAVDRKCPDVKWVAHYALLGPYDFMDVYEADSMETAARVSMITRANGALTAESWPAMDWRKFLDVVHEVEEG